MAFDRWTHDEKHLVSRQSGLEETLNSLTHALGVLFGVVATALLLRFTIPTGDLWFSAGIAIFGTTVVVLYASSTLYHWARSPRRKRLLQVIDHVAIYLLIAGTYTPFALGPLREDWGWGMLALIWSLALGGMALEAKRAVRNRAVSIALYLGMGWLAILSFPTLLALLPIQAVIWLLAGGTSYTIGTAFFLWNRLPFHHTVWHLFALLGTVCHFCAILHLLAPDELVPNFLQDFRIAGR
ncbi:MAG: hemolysin III family protein [Planctomycetes bacterium]|nr:hemolysin III family protein [Planctomycetota bacterium]